MGFTSSCAKAKIIVINEKWHEIATGVDEADTAVQLIVVSRLSLTTNKYKQIFSLEKSV